MKVQVSNTNTPNWRDITVKSQVPTDLKCLEILAKNLWWSWNNEAINLFKSIDKDLWKSVHENPVLFLQRIGYEKLEEILAKQGVTNVNACIAYTEHEDKHLHNDSVCFHKKLGYKTVGIFHKCAYKFDKWYDMIWMEKFIAEHSANPNDIIPYPMLNC